MPMRLAAAAFITLISLPAAFALDGHPAAQCGFNEDKSNLVLTVSNGGDGAYACTASCQYTVTGERPLQTFSCNFSLGANADEKIACDLDGKGPGHFNEVRPTRFVCQPR